MTMIQPQATAVDPFEAIERLKRERRAIVLAHYYQDPDIQDVADYLGDSLGLSQQAASTDADVIVFCGVHFMAETAKILNPGKTVLMPDLDAGCSLSDSCPADRFAAWRLEHPGLPAVSYINCSAQVKALSDVICTSSNAIEIVARLPGDGPVLFAPDRHLAAHVARHTGRTLIPWPGACHVHEVFSERKLVELKGRHPEAVVLAHPECDAAVLAHADVIGSTSRLLETAVQHPAATFIVVTEAGILHQMQKRAPGKTFVPAPPNNQCACNECPFMRVQTLDKVVSALERLSPAVDVPEPLRGQALLAIRRMLEPDLPVTPLSPDEIRRRMESPLPATVLTDRRPRDPGAC
ncbi:MAG: quinolinate synthase NadA [Candidatus Sericytochromatia bacterium]|nr:quinolinate synthase NadA [Candidatus Sericytochromatia bacterium]